MKIFPAETDWHIVIIQVLLRTPFNTALRTMEFTRKECSSPPVAGQQSRFPCSSQVRAFLFPARSFHFVSIGCHLMPFFLCRCYTVEGNLGSVRNTTFCPDGVERKETVLSPISDHAHFIFSYSS